MDKWLRRGSLTGIVEIDWIIADFWLDEMRKVFWERTTKIYLQHMLDSGYCFFRMFPVFNKNTGWIAMKSRIKELDYYHYNTNKIPSI